MPTPHAARETVLPADIKRLNRRRIVECFRGGETLTAADIHERSGISRPTVMRALQDFCLRGVLKSQGLGSSASVGGMKPELFSFAEERSILCVALWPDAISLALSGLIGGVYAQESFPFSRFDSLQASLDELEKVSGAYMERQGVAKSDLYGVAVSVPGTVDYDTRVLRYNVKAPGWGSNIPMEQYLRPIFGQRAVCFVDNAGKAAGRALLLDHPEYARQRLISVFSTWGVSACMMERGHVLNGRDALIGEIGHSVISSAGPSVCACGKRGCLESLVSIENVRRMLGETGDETLGTGVPITFAGLFAASENGDRRARRAVGYLAHCFGVALHNLSLTYNQELVVFQGDFAWADAYFDQCLKRELGEFRYYPDGVFFEIKYDRRELRTLAAQGGASVLQKQFFESLDDA